VQLDIPQVAPSLDTHPFTFMEIDQDQIDQSRDQIEFGEGELEGSNQPDNYSDPVLFVQAKSLESEREESPYLTSRHDNPNVEVKDSWGNQIDQYQDESLRLSNARELSPNNYSSNKHLFRNV
jgi:hypothetical protein